MQPFIEGGGPFLIKWYKNEIELQQSDKEYLLFSSFTFEDLGTYRVSVTNNYGEVLSESITIILDKPNSNDIFLPFIRKINSEHYRITFPTIIGVDYQLQKSSDLINWLNIGDSTTAIKSHTNFLILGDSTPEFFRISTNYSSN
mgnify:FL=1